MGIKLLKGAESKRYVGKMKMSRWRRVWLEWVFEKLDWLILNVVVIQLKSPDAQRKAPC